MDLKGTIYFLVFIIFIALSGVYQAHLSQIISPLIFLFFSSFTSMCFFSAICCRNNGFKFITKPARHKKNLFCLNVTNFLVWFCYMFAIKFLEPAIAATITNALGPIFVIIFSKALRPHIQIFRIEKLAAIGIAISLIFMIQSTLSGKSAISVPDMFDLILGIIFSFIAGIGQVLFSIYSKKLSEDGYSPTEILAWRYPLVVGISFILIDKSMLHELIHTPPVIINALLLSLFGMIIPVYFYQKGVKLIEPIFISILYIIEPIIMFIGQIFDPRLRISIFSYFGVLFICLFSLLSVFGRYYGNKMVARKV